MGTFGWVLIAGAFLMFVMVANNSWPWVWSKIQQGIPQPGQGNQIVPTPPETEGSFTYGPQTGDIPLNTSNPSPQGNITTPPNQLVNTVNGIVQSSSGGPITA